MVLSIKTDNTAYQALVLVLLWCGNNWKVSVTDWPTEWMTGLVHERLPPLKMSQWPVCKVYWSANFGYSTTVQTTDSTLTKVMASWLVFKSRWNCTAYFVLKLDRIYCRKMQKFWNQYCIQIILGFNLYCWPSLFFISLIFLLSWPA